MTREEAIEEANDLLTDVQNFRPALTLPGVDVIKRLFVRMCRLLVYVVSRA